MFLTDGFVLMVDIKDHWVVEILWKLYIFIEQHFLKFILDDVNSVEVSGEKWSEHLFKNLQPINWMSLSLLMLN